MIESPAKQVNSQVRVFVMQHDANLTNAMLCNEVWLIVQHNFGVRVLTYFADDWNCKTKLGSKCVYFFHVLINKQHLKSMIYVMHNTI